MHWLVIDFIHYSSISSRGCKRIWWWKTKLKQLKCKTDVSQLSFRRFSSILKWKNHFPWNLGSPVSFSCRFCFTTLDGCPVKIVQFCKLHNWESFVLVIDRQQELQIQGKLRLTQIKEKKKKNKWYKKARKVSFVQYNSRWVINGSSMSNQLHQWVISSMSNR